MTLCELLEYPFLHNASILTGEESLHSEVTSCLPFYGDKQPALCSLPGTLLVCGDSDTLHSFAAEESKKEPTAPCAVVFWGKYRKETIPFGYFRKRSIVLIHVPYNGNILNFTKQCMSVLYLQFNRERYIESWLRELCFGQTEHFDDTLSAHLGYHPRYKYHCLLLKVKQAAEISPLILAKDLKYAANFLIKETAFPSSDMLYFQESDTGVLFLPSTAVQTNPEIQEKIKVAVCRLKNTMNQYKWRVSLGSPAHTIQEFRESYHNAMLTEHVTRSLHVHEDVHLYQQWYVHILMTSYPKEPLLKAMRHILGPILDKEELLETLIDYLTFGESQKITAEHMYIHTNTLKYRLQQISKLLECDLKDPNTRFSLRFAVTLYRYFKYSEKT